MKETKFEEDLKTYFPEIYRIHKAGQFDKYIWEAFESMMQMVDCNGYGEIKIVYQDGKINRVVKSLVMTTNTKGPDLTRPGKI